MASDTTASSSAGELAAGAAAVVVEATKQLKTINARLEERVSNIMDAEGIPPPEQSDEEVQLLPVSFPSTDALLPAAKEFASSFSTMVEGIDRRLTVGAAAAILAVVLSTAGNHEAGNVELDKVIENAPARTVTMQAPTRSQDETTTPKLDTAKQVVTRQKALPPQVPKRVTAELPQSSSDSVSLPAQIAGALIVGFKALSSIAAAIH